MTSTRSPLAHGMGITLRRFPAFLWTYIFNLGLAVLFSIRFHAQLSSILSHSLASQRLTTAFDLGVVAETFRKFDEGPGGGGAGNYGGVILYFLLYFLLIPGTLFSYQTAVPARLSTLLGEGLRLFWRFVRITLLALIVFAIILGPLTAAHKAWSNYLDAHTFGLGRNGFLLNLAAVLLILLVASILRLYFDLVEVYTVQLGQTLRPNGRPDRRVRRTLRPAWRTLRIGFLRNWLSFLLPAFLGAAAFYLFTRTAIHSLAQPRAWFIFLLTQIGLFLMLFARFWQRGFETALSLDYPLVPVQPLHPTYPPPPPSRDPIPDPEPAAPPLPGPDPAVFHHDVTSRPE